MADDLKIGQMVAASKDIEARIQSAAPGAEARILDLLTQFEKAFPGTVLADRASQAATISQGIETAVVADAQAFGRLTSEFKIPLALAGGIKLQGTGQLLDSARATYEGLRSSMTKAQKVVSELCGWLQVLSVTAGLVLAMHPTWGNVGLGGGLTVGLAIGALRDVIIPRISKYSDAAPRAELVKLPTQK